MVRTRADSSARKAVAAKAPRKQVGNSSGASSSSSSKTPSKKGGYSSGGGGNPLRIRDVPSWQKGIAEFYPKINKKKKIESAEDEPCGSSNSNGVASVVEFSSTSTVTKPMTENDDKEHPQNGEVADGSDKKGGEALNTEDCDNKTTALESNGCPMDTDEKVEKSEASASKENVSSMLDAGPGPSGSGMIHDEAVPQSNGGTMKTGEHAEKTEEGTSKNGGENFVASPGPLESGSTHGTAVPQDDWNSMDTDDHAEKTEKCMVKEKGSKASDSNPGPSGSGASQDKSVPQGSGSSNDAKHLEKSDGNIEGSSKENGSSIVSASPGPSGSQVSQDEAVPNVGLITMDTDELTEKAEIKEGGSSIHNGRKVVDSKPGTSGSGVNHEEAMPGCSNSSC